MTKPSTPSAEMQKLTPKEFETQIRKQLADKLCSDGTYHVTPELMDNIIAERKRQMALERWNRALSQKALETLECLKAREGCPNCIKALENVLSPLTIHD